MLTSEAKKRAIRSRKFRAWRRPRLAKGVLGEAHKASDSLSRSLAIERHFTPAELGKLWGLSAETIRALFEREPGVLIVSTTEPGKRRYRTFRIPQRIAERVHTRLSSQC
jgi:hypothetical protein